jgi:N-methylhydantoinase A/oxoprolinase/acetone carboxylase beta subunit
LVRSARADLKHEGFGPKRQVLTRSVDVRYVGQSFEITLPLTADLRAVFDREHGRTYGYANPARPIEIVNVRVTATGVTDKPTMPYRRPRRNAPTPAARRHGRFGGKQHKVAMYRWTDLPPGASARGPAVITGAEATVVIPPGWRFKVDGFGNVLAEVAR